MIYELVEYIFLPSRVFDPRRCERMFPGRVDRQYLLAYFSDEEIDRMVVLGVLVPVVE